MWAVPMHILANHLAVCPTSVRPPVCVYVTLASHAKTAEPIEMTFREEKENLRGLKEP